MDRDKESTSIERISTQIKVATEYFDNVIFFPQFYTFSRFYNAALNISNAASWFNVTHPTGDVNYVLPQANTHSFSWKRSSLYFSI